MKRLLLWPCTVAACAGLIACASLPAMTAEEGAGARCSAQRRPVASADRVVVVRVIVGPGGRASKALLTHPSGDAEVDTWLLCQHLAHPWRVSSGADMARGFIVNTPLALRAGQQAPDPWCGLGHQCLRPPTPGSTTP